MNTTIQDLRTAIYNKLNTLTWAWNPIVEVLDYNTIDKTGFPYVVFEPLNMTSEVQDTCSNMRTYTFDINVYQELSQWRQEAINIVTNCFQRITDLFDADYTLWWLCQWWVIPSNWEFWQIINWDGMICFVNVRISCKVLHNIIL